jgi:hypothetical protein
MTWRRDRLARGPAGTEPAGSFETALPDRHSDWRHPLPDDNPVQPSEGAREEISPDQKREILAALEEDDAWIAGNTEILPAQVRTALKAVGGDFVDDILAAQGSVRIFLSEDQVLRAVAAAEFSVPSTWLQPVLMRGVDEGLITRSQYAAALSAFVDSGLDFTSINHETLLQTLHGVRSHALPAAFSKLARRLGGKKADMPSHLGVAGRTIRATWPDESLSWTVRQAVVGTLLYELSKGRLLDEFAIVFRAVRQLGTQLGDPRFAEYLNAWTRGHFIKME